MASITDLPVEILLQIIENTLLENKYKPIIGDNAAWQPLPRFRQHQPAIPDPRVLNSSENEEFPAKLKYPSTIKALRLTNKDFKPLVEPYLFSELNILDDWDVERTNNVVKYIVEPYWQHIHIIRTYIDDAKISEESGISFATHVPGILAKCRNLHSLGLYYNLWPLDFGDIGKEVLSLLEGGTLDTLGIYSTVILDDRWAPALEDRESCEPMELIDSIGASKVAKNALRRFDIATEWMTKESYDLIRSTTFANLENFTVRYSFRHDELWIHDPIERRQWCPSIKLVRLHLLNCQIAYSPDIPFIVEKIDTLDELLVSTCGYGGDVIPLPPAPGWSRRQDALWRSRRPLSLFSLEHMGCWEIRELGVIPTTTLVCSNVRRRDLIEAMEADRELFPGLKLLRVLPDKYTVPLEDEDESVANEEVVSVEDSDDEPAHPEESQAEEVEEEPVQDSAEVVEQQRIQALIDEMRKRLDAVCEIRHLELRRDAQRQMSCFCCSY